MSQVNITLNTNTVDINTTNNQIVVTDPTNPTTVSVVQPVTTVVEVITAGPQGPIGPIGPGSNINTGSFVTTSSFNAFTSSYNTGSFTGSFTGNLIGTSSWAGNAISASYALSSSFASSTISSSFAATASFVTGSNIFGPFGSNSIISSSFAVSSSRAVSASFAISASFTTSASFAVSSSRAISASWAPMRPGGSDTQIQFNSGSALLGTGSFTFDYTNQSLRQGLNIVASGLYSHAQGTLVTASGSYSHAEGVSTIAIGNSSHAEGYTTVTTGDYSHAEGDRTQAIGVCSHAEGVTTVTTGDYSHAEGDSTQTIGIASHAEGISTIALGQSSHAEGYTTVTTGDYSHAEGVSTQAIGYASHAEGEGTHAVGAYSHAEGAGTQALGNYSHAEGENTQTIGIASHAEGISTIASGTYSHAEGQNTRAIGNFSHAEGDSTVAQGNGSHAEGYECIAIGEYSHAEGVLTSASADYSHAEGVSTQALGLGSHAEGYGTVTAARYQHVQGQFNISSSVQSAFIIGNGQDTNNRSNLVFAAGNNVQITGSVNVSGGITGSLFGTSSWAINAVSSSNALTASFAVSSSRSVSSSFAISSSFATSASFVISSSFATSASQAQNATTASYVLNAISSSFATTASFVTGSNVFGPFGSNSILSASHATFAQTASFALNGGVTQLLAGPNITLAPTNGLGQVTISSTSGGGFNTATGSYGSFYDTTTQINPVGNIPRSMSLNTTDISNGVSVSGSTNPFNTYIKTENAGVYNIQFSAQVEKTDSGTDEIVIWLRKNGIDLTDTATTITLVGNSTKVVAAWNWFVTSAANDYYQIIWISADTGMRLLAETISATHPGIPSVIVTANRVDQFLSNTGSFSGSFTGQFTGSFSGSGANLNSIPASAITGLNLSQIASGSFTASVSPTQFTVTSGSVTELTVTGTGVTLGSVSTDIHRVTGSLLVSQGITGSLFGTASFAVSASNIPVDVVPTSGSNNAPSSNGVFDALASKQRNLREFDTKEGFYLFEDFIGNPNALVSSYGVSTTTIGAGATCLPTTTYPNRTNQQGVLQLGTGTTATGTSNIRVGDNNAGSIYTGNGEIIMQCFYNVQTLSTITERFYEIIGFTTSANVASTNTISFIYDEGGIGNYGLASANWKCITRVSPTSTTTITTVPVVEGQWYVLKIVINSLGNSINFFIDNVLVATHTTNIPTLITPRIAKVKTIGTTNRNSFLDYMLVQQIYATPRTL